MNGEELKAMKEVVDAGMKPLAVTVKDIAKRQIKMEERQIEHGTDIAVMKDKVAKVGNCEVHEEKIKEVKEDLDDVTKKTLPEMNKKLWGIAIGIPALLLIALRLAAYLKG